MRYRLSTDKLVNMFMPPFLRGRKHVLWVQSLLFPFQKLNDTFSDYAKDKKIDAVMTCQVIWFEWYLNRKFSMYFIDSNDEIVIAHQNELGVPLYMEGTVIVKPFVVWGENEDWSTNTNPEENPKPFHYQDESRYNGATSFEVLVPRISISHDKFTPMISGIIDIYKLAGKTYKITIAQ